MEADLSPTPAAEPADAQPEAPEESASLTTAPTQEDAFMNAIIRGAVPDSASNQGDDGDGDLADDAADGESAQPRDAKPTDQPGQQPGRRSRRAVEAATEIERLKAEKAALEARVLELNPPLPDATEETRKAILAAEERYRRLTNKPDDDADWTTDDYQWLQDEKKKRAVVPELRRHYDTVIERDRQVLREAHEAERVDFWSRVQADMASGAELPGVDLDALKKAPNFAARDRLIYAAATATRDAEVKRLREELASTRRDLLGTVQPPLNGGASGSGRTFDEDTFMNTLMRSGVRG